MIAIRCAIVLLLATAALLKPGLADAADREALLAARAAVERRDYAAALPIYQGLLAVEPTDSDLLIEAARVNGFADRNREAAALYRRVLAVAPGRRGDVLASLAWQSLWAGDAAAAETLFTELAAAADAAKDGPGGADARDGLGQARLATGDNAGAARAFSEALALRPGELALQRRLGRALLWNDQPEAAAALLERVRAQHPDDHEAAWMLGNAYSFSDRQRAALAAFAAAGAPAGNGERLDLARTWAWAGFEDRAAPLLAGQSAADAVWLRDWRVGRELAPTLYGSIEHSIDRDRLDVWSVTSGAGLHPHGSDTLDLRIRRIRMSDPSGSPVGNELRASYRWRLGEPGSAYGTLWPSLALGATHYGDWTPLTGAARATWLPQDGWRVDGELTRETIETPTAVANRVTVDVMSLGADRRFGPRWSGTAAVAALRFDDANERTRLNGRLEYLIGLRPRWSVGIEALGFDSSKPTGPGVPGRGYWNPRRYDEERVFSTWRWEQRPWNVFGRLAVGTASEIDGDGSRSRGRPNQWEAGVGYDINARLRATATVGGSGGSFGISPGNGYWRRSASVGLSAWL